jgi:TonB family protein
MLMRLGLWIGVLGFAPLALSGFQVGPGSQDEPPRLAAIRVPRWIPGTGSSPAYPEEARQRGISGSVSLDLRVDDSGNVTSAKVVKPLDPQLDELALNALRTRKYQPAAFGGPTLPAIVHVNVPFLPALSGGGILGGLISAGLPPFNAPTGLAVDRDGNVYVADAGRSIIYKINSTGTTMSVFAGDGKDGFQGDGGPASSSQFNVPYDLAMDDAGNLYIADTGNSRIRRITPSGTISTVAGNGTAGFSGDGGAATAAQLNKPLGIAVDPEGTLYIADTDNARIRSVSPDGIIRTVAGTGVTTFSGDGGPAISAQIGLPYDVAVDRSRNIFLADDRNQRVRKIAPDGVVTTVMEGDTIGVATDPAGNLYVVDGGSARVSRLQSGVVSALSLDPNLIALPTRIASDGRGNVYVADGSSGIVRKISAAGIVTSVPINRATPSPAL